MTTQQTIEKKLTINSMYIAESLSIHFVLIVINRDASKALTKKRKKYLKEEEEYLLK